MDIWESVYHCIALHFDGEMGWEMIQARTEYDGVARFCTYHSAGYGVPT